MAFRGFHGDDAHITFFIKKGEEESSDLSVMAGSLAKILFLWYITKLGILQFPCTLDYITEECEL